MRVAAKPYSNKKPYSFATEANKSPIPTSDRDTRLVRRFTAAVATFLALTYGGPVVKDYFTQGKITPVRATESYVGDTPFPAGLFNKGDIFVIAERGGDKSFFPCVPNKDNKTCTAKAVGVNVTEPRRDLTLDTNTLKIVTFKATL
ncbi:MAG: hypothetical protein EOM37_07830 [Proteobacteria bacterium]|jgi:hypothetical protein|nr:hypothetical protein [Alphaproteobacteria bacterium]NCC03939.1 hypothetical protein [Pseudomonadota bacterium]